MDAALHTRTLLLSREYAPVKVISWQRALTLLTLGKVEVLEEYDGFVRSPTIVIKIPAVVRLLRAFKKFRHPVKFSRANIYGRDGYRCQYCGTKRRIADLSFDHVVPRAQGGKTVWTNIVTACEACNLRKGGRTPEQAGVRLLRKPVQPTAVPSVTIRLAARPVPEAWRDYLYWTGSLGDGVNDP